MAKITLDSVASGYDLSKINSNFVTIAAALNDEVLYRDNPVGEVNTLLTEVDANSQSIYNIPTPTLAHEVANKAYVDNVVGDAPGYAAAAAASAAAALVSENNAASSETNAGISEVNSLASANAASASEIAAGISETNAAASAIAANVLRMEWQGDWLTATAYAVNDVIFEAGSSYICLTAHTSGVFATDLAAVKWELVAQKGNDGAGTVIDITPADTSIEVGGTASHPTLKFVGGEQSLTGFYYPAAGSAFQDMYRSGWLPSWFNQQWGGAQWGTLPDGSFGSVATGNVQQDSLSSNAIGYNNTYLYMTQGFKLSESITNPTIWVKLYKIGSYASTVNCAIYSDDGSGLPNALIGGASGVPVKTVTSKTDGEWYAFTPSCGTLSANTQYHIHLNAGNDTSNYLRAVGSSRSKYPHGVTCSGSSVPVYTPAAGEALCFLIQNPAANSLIQSSGMFDHKLAFNPGTPANQSRSVAQPLSNFYDGKTCSVLYRGTYAVSTNVWDFCYGLDHDRITLTINASGYPVLTIYESDRTVATVTGTGSVASGNHDVGIRVRTMGDGADYATLYVDGVSVGTPLTAQTFTMDVNMVTLGTARLGDGFGLAPTWTQDMQMTSLPSAQGWTWAGTATEANAVSIQNNKLYQNANGYTSTQTGYYTKVCTFNNATGWSSSVKMRCASSTNATSSQSCWFQVADGSKFVAIEVHEYFIQIGGGSYDFVIQGDFKSQDHVFTLCGKGTDYYLLIDGRLAVDGTGKLTSATVSNVVAFGDASVTASQNADAIWSYVKYYQGGMILPITTTGTCSEFAHWSGDKSTLFPSLYNSGSPVSVKQLCGVPRNYQFEAAVQREVRRGVTSGPTTTSTTATLLTDMECYVVGQGVVSSFTNLTQHSAGGQTVDSALYVDGAQPQSAFVNPHSPTANYNFEAALVNIQTNLPVGLHKVEGRWATSASTATSPSTRRTLTVEATS